MLRRIYASVLLGSVLLSPSVAIGGSEGKLEERTTPNVMDYIFNIENGYFLDNSSLRDQADDLIIIKGLEREVSDKSSKLPKNFVLSYGLPFGNGNTDIEVSINKFVLRYKF
ncbi:MAG: hypothetical protein IH845_05430 [Nanoarchaeota archaeon]|nr:hypothetical protein [Nanoarchaeota archaeon]